MNATAQPAPGAPATRTLTHLKSSNLIGSLYLGSCVATTALALYLSTRPGVVAWLAGQALLALAFLRWFALLHESGHETLFRMRRLNEPVGHVAAFFSLIPFHNWKRVHGRHHKWTGWQDVDPTTASLVPRELSRAELWLVNIAWRFWIPMFSVIYRINNFWNIPRLRTLFKNEAERRALTWNVVVMLALYVALVAAVGAAPILRSVGLALVLSFMVEDLLILSQHTHIPQHVSHGEPVRPFPAIDQEVFTRSLKFPAWVSAWLMNLDAHELHHMYPFVPGYRLTAIQYPTENEIGWWRWLRGAKRLRGEVFLFQHRHESGADI